MQILTTLLLFILSILLTACDNSLNGNIVYSENNSLNTENTIIEIEAEQNELQDAQTTGVPTLNVQGEIPHFVMWDDVLYQYDTELQLDEDTIDQMEYIGEVTCSISQHILPSDNGESNFLQKGVKIYRYSEYSILCLVYYKAVYNHDSRQVEYEPLKKPRVLLCSKQENNY